MGNDYYNDRMLSKWEDEYLEEHEDKEYDNNYYLENQDLIYQDRVDEELMKGELQCINFEEEKKENKWIKTY